MSSLRNTGLLAILMLIPFVTDGQQKYWIYLNHKNHLPKNCSPEYCRNKQLEELTRENVDPIVYSEWLGAVSAFLDNNTFNRIAKLPSVDSIRFINPGLRISQAGIEPAQLDAALSQIHADALIREGLTGKDIIIGIVDAGFYRADRIRNLDYVFTNKGYLDFRNFVEPEIDDPFSRIRSNDHHGSRVWELIAGYNPEKQEYTGLARNSKYLLARTDEDPREYRGEEDFWIAAVEWMASKGARIINSSLGYADGHDNPEEDYLPQQADGKFSTLTRFAEIAVNEKGLLIIMSAGNSGNDSFSVVNIPADAPGVVAVGATHLNHWSRQNYSSIGKYTLPVIKPDLSCYSSAGTSFAAPVITGMAACLLEFDQTMSNFDLIQLMKKSGNLRNFPNNYLGYGVPDARRALMILKGIPVEERSRLVIAETDSIEIHHDANKPVLFHKQNTWEVIDQEALEGNHDIWIIKRPSETVTHTTFATTSEAIEIIWPD